MPNRPHVEPWSFSSSGTDAKLSWLTLSLLSRIPAMLRTQNLIGTQGIFEQDGLANLDRIELGETNPSAFVGTSAPSSSCVSASWMLPTLPVRLLAPDESLFEKSSSLNLP